MAHAETVLGQASDTIQSFRELLVQAGNGANTASDLGTITSQLVTLRNQLLSYANTTDANGQALFGGLGSTATPFVEPNATAGVVFAGLGGQSRGTDLTIPNTIDGQAAFANISAGAFAIMPSATNTGGASASGATINTPTSPNVLAGDSYQINFTSATTYTITDLSANPPTTSGSQTMTGSTVTFGGATNNDQQMTITGTPRPATASPPSPRPRSSTSWTARSRASRMPAAAPAPRPR
jgi:flagellar hook-associated protein 3 FlgL